MTRIFFFLFSILLSYTASAENGKERVQRLIRIIAENSDSRFSPLYQVIVVDRKDENNAWSLANFIVITKGTLDILNDGELTAVIAHEMAHRERGHIYRRMSTSVGVPVILAVQKLRYSLTGEYSLETDTAFMEFLAGFNEYHRLQHEIQADCHAYNWLKKLKVKGFPADPLDLNRARNKMMEIDFDSVVPEYFADLPPYIRHQKVIEGYTANCD